MRKMMKEEERLRNELKWKAGSKYAASPEWYKVSRLIAALVKSVRDNERDLANKDFFIISSRK